jgi:hypothetical protein
MKANLREKSGLAMDSQQPRLADQPAAELAQPRGLSGELSEEADLTIAHCHFCRGCGQPLPPGSRRLFHPDCLKADKRRRVREQRQQQYELFARWLLQQSCPKCGARCGELRSKAVTGTPCEASQPP